MFKKNNYSKFFKDNTHEVNRIIAISLMCCFFVLIILMLSDYIGIFHFNKALKLTILVMGFFTTTGPYVLYRLNAPDGFVKYYSLASMAIFICLLGTNNGIGIYITYILVPLVSCLYFNKRLTIRVSIFSYFTMMIGVYVNCAGKLEVRFLNWSHWTSFRNYMIGFTLEYIVALVFIIQLAKRSQDFFELFEENMEVLTTEYDKQERISEIYSQTISERKKTAYDVLTKESAQLTPNCYSRLAAGHQFVAGIQDALLGTTNLEAELNAAIGKTGEYFSLDRITFMLPAIDEGSFRLQYQWARNNEDIITDYCGNIPAEQIDIIVKEYDEKGYLEMYKSTNTDSFEAVSKIDSGFTEYISNSRLGAQLWIPGITAGEYNGAICFDKKDEEPYSIVDKFLLFEVTGVLSAHVIRLESDKANQAKSIFLSNMSHEIRTPMNAIIGMTQVALREDMSDKVRKSLNIINSSAEGLLGLINDILDFSKIESGKIDIVPAKYSVASLVNDLKTIGEARNIDKGLEFSINISKDFPAFLFGDLVRVKQIMVNLLTNAIKYTDEGSVTVNISIGEKDDENNAILHYEVIDTGQGIREEDRSRLFKSFTQLNLKKNHNVEGTGLGLAISMQLVELMGGKIGVDSEFGKGSTFYIDVPQTIVGDAPIGDVENYKYDDVSENGEIDFKAPGKKVLIVDDNMMNRMVAEDLLEPFEMEISTAEDGYDAIDQIKREKFDIIFMDHFMPGKDGVQTTREIRAMEGNPNQNVPIIALTADAFAEVKEMMLREGMNDFLAKPIDINATIKVLKRFL